MISLSGRFVKTVLTSNLSLQIPAKFSKNFSKMSCKEVSKLSDSEVADWFNSFDTVMTDCDGVLWVGGGAIEGSPDMIQRFRALGKKVFYVTNNSTKHRREYKSKVDKLGFGGEMDEIVGTAYLAAAYLEQIGFDKNKLVYVVGSAGITQELDDVGIKYLPIGVLAPWWQQYQQLQEENQWFWANPASSCLKLFKRDTLASIQQEH